MNAAVIQAASLCKRYGDRAAVTDATFEIRGGEVFGLLGPNGAGKTTTILMLLGLTEVSSGTIRVLDRDPQRAPLQVKREVGYMPDAVGFYDALTARENLAFSAKLMGIPRSGRAGRIEAALERVGLAGVGGNKVATFSRGMRQRLGLAEVIMKQARVAVLDEPTSGLDPQAAEDFLTLINDLRHDGVTVLLSSHMLEHMQRICDRVALFHAGRIALLGSVDELARQVLGGHRYVNIEARAGQALQLLRGIEGVRQVEQAGEHRYRLLADRDVRSQAAHAIVSAGGELLRMDDDTPGLDVIYNRYFESAHTEEEHATT